MWLDFHSPLTPVYFFFLKECLALVLSVLAGDGVIPSDFLCLNYPAFSFFLRSCIAWVRRWMLQNFLKELHNKISNASLGATRHERGTWKGEKKRVSDPVGTLTCNLMQEKVYSQWPLLLPLLLDSSCEGCPSQVCPHHFLSDTCLCFLS